MPNVPVYQRRVEQQSAPNIRVGSSAPIEAFGGGSGAAQVTSAARNLVDVGQKIFLEEKQKADDTAVQEAYTQSMREKNRLMYDQKDGAMLRQGKNAFGVIDEYTPRFSKYNDDLEKNLSRDQAQMFQKLRANQETEFTETLQRHTFKESQSYQEDTSKAGVIAARENGILNYQTPGAIEKSINDQKIFIADLLEKKGFDLNSDVAKTEINKAVGDTHVAIIQRMLANNQSDLAAKYYDKVKGQLAGAGDAATMIEAKIADSKINNESVKVWDTVSRFKLADGEPDLNKMQNTIMAMPVSNEVKQKYWQYSEARAIDESKQKNNSDAAQKYSVTNAVLKAKKGGKKLQTALDEIIPKYSGDLVKQHEFEEIAKKLYTSEVRTDPQKYVELWNMYKDGGVNGNMRPAINATEEAFAKNQISGSDYEEFMKMAHNESHREDEWMKKQVIENLKDLTKEKFSKNKAGQEKANSFLYSVIVNSRGKTPEETQKIADDMLKNSPDSGWTMPLTGWKFGEQPGYRVEKEKIDATNQVIGTLHQDLGEVVTDAIGGPSGLDRFQQSLGVPYDALKKGTPVNNAIISLRKQRLKDGKAPAINKKNIDAVLKKYPSGVWNGE